MNQIMQRMWTKAVASLLGLGVASAALAQQAPVQMPESPIPPGPLEAAQPAMPQRLPAGMPEQGGVGTPPARYPNYIPVGAQPAQPSQPTQPMLPTQPMQPT